MYVYVLFIHVRHFCYVSRAHSLEGSSFNAPGLSHVEHRLAYVDL